jgi:hypothetical protein
MGQGTSKYRKIMRTPLKSYSITQLLNYSVLFCPYVSSCIDSILYIYIYIKIYNIKNILSICNQVPGVGV